MTLTEYLDVASRQPWRWGRMDCVQFGLGWVAAATGQRPVAPFDYASADEARAYIQAQGGLEKVVGDFLERLGFARTSWPEDGDVGVVAMPPRGVEEVASASVVIRRGPWWIGKSLRGIASVSAESVPAWRVL